MDEPTMAALLRQQGMQGTQSGPADESTTMAIERALQYLGSLGLGGVGGAAGFGVGGSPGAAGPIALGAHGMKNATDAPIQDVYLHRLHQYMKQK
jgi:hypothetical protein